MNKLTACVSDNVKEFINESGLKFELIEKFGSPINLVFPQEFENNVLKFKQVFSANGVVGRIWFAYKSSKAHSFLEMIIRQKIGVEVSSIQELKIALSHGISGENIGVSGSLKKSTFLLLAMQHNCTIVIDSYEELNTIQFLHKTIEFPYTIKILIRLSGFEITRIGRNEPCAPIKENSRFGINLNSKQNLHEFLSESEIKKTINLIGFSFHIDNHSVRDRGEAIITVIELINSMRSLGYENCNVINIGGGYSVKYIEPEAWNAFINNYTQSIINKEPFMFRDKSFGVIINNGQRKSRGNFYPYENTLFKDLFLDSIFKYIPNKLKSTVGNNLVQNNIEVIIEPGKSLVDQAGLTLCSVKGIKETTNNDKLVLCEMNISHIFEQLTGSEFAVDPILSSINRDVLESDAKFYFYLAGNLCLESDILSWRKICFNKVPQKDDLLTFINTAGYQMDFIESEMHQMPLAKKIAIYSHKGNWHWKFDKDFSVLEMI